MDSKSFLIQNYNLVVKITNKKQNDIIILLCGSLHCLQSVIMGGVGFVPTNSSHLEPHFNIAFKLRKVSGVTTNNKHLFRRRAGFGIAKCNQTHTNAKLSIIVINQVSIIFFWTILLTGKSTCQSNFFDLIDNCRPKTSFLFRSAVNLAYFCILSWASRSHTFCDNFCMMHELFSMIIVSFIDNMICDNLWQVSIIMISDVNHLSIINSF